MARFDSGEVLLTAGIRHVMQRVLHRVIPWDAALGEFAGKAELVQPRHARRLPEAQPALGVIAAGQFDLHVPLALALSQRQREERRFVNFQRDGHAARIPTLTAQASLVPSRRQPAGKAGGRALHRHREHQVHAHDVILGRKKEVQPSPAFCGHPDHVRRGNVKAPSVRQRDGEGAKRMRLQQLTELLNHGRKAAQTPGDRKRPASLFSATISRDT